MRVQNCFHPKSFVNPYTGERTVARCGKCPACLNSRASSWVTRLDMEASCHKYVLFCTLTFDEQHVAQIVRLPYKTDNKNELPEYVDASTGEYFDFSDLCLSHKDVQYLRNSRVLRVLQKRDFQLFIKRLRYYYNDTEAGALLRYYLCGEIGPSTYRPHGHLLLFFDSDKCAENIELLLHKAWSDRDGSLLGNIYDPHFVSGSASSYCASYINSVTELPRNYLHKGLRPFSLFSKRPPIGSLYPSIKEVREIFDSGDIKFRRFSESSKTFKDDYFWKSFTSRLYPRCQRFGCLSHDDRVTLYRLVEEFPSYLSARKVARRIKAEYIDCKPQKDTFLGRYFREIAFKRKKSIHFRKDTSYIYDYKNLPFLPSQSITPASMLFDKSIIRVYNESSLVSFVSAIRRVQYQAQIFGVTIPEYVSKIELYYENVNKQKLIDDYEYQSSYFSHNPAWHIIYFDYDFYRKVTQCDRMQWGFRSQLYVDYLFNWNTPFKHIDVHDGFKTVLDIPALDSVKDFMDFKLLHLKISHDLVKQKKNNDYAMAKKDRYGKVLTIKD